MPRLGDLGLRDQPFWRWRIVIEVLEVPLALELVAARDIEPGPPLRRAPEFERVDVAVEPAETLGRALESRPQRTVSMRTPGVQALIARLPQDRRRLLPFEAQRNGLERRPAIRVRVVLSRKERRAPH